MKPSELYERKPQEEASDINTLRGSYYNHIPEIDRNMCSYFSDYSIAKNTRVIIKVHKHVDFDSRRYWRLASVWFDDKPVMITQNAGREGDDHHKRFITNKGLYIEMIDFIKTLFEPDTDFEGEEDVVKENDVVDGLTYFYGDDLDGSFN